MQQSNIFYIVYSVFCKVQSIMLSIIFGSWYFLASTASKLTTSMISLIPKPTPRFGQTTLYSKKRGAISKHSVYSISQSEHCYWLMEHFDWQEQLSYTFCPIRIHVCYNRPSLILMTMSTMMSMMVMKMMMIMVPWMMLVSYRIDKK